MGFLLYFEVCFFSSRTAKLYPWSFLFVFRHPPTAKIAKPSYHRIYTYESPNMQYSSYGYVLWLVLSVLQDIILGRFEGGNEETKTAAAYSLGHIAVGNMTMWATCILLFDFLFFHFPHVITFLFFFYCSAFGFFCFIFLFVRPSAVLFFPHFFFCTFVIPAKYLIDLCRPSTRRSFSVGVILTLLSIPVWCLGWRHQCCSMFTGAPSKRVHCDTCLWR